MRKIGIHYFVWTDGKTQEGLELALEKAAEHGYKIIELGYIDPERFSIDRVAKKAQALDLEIVATTGLAEEMDVSSEDPERVARGRAFLADALKVIRDMGGIRLGGIIYSMHGKYLKMPTEKNWMNSVEVIAETAEIAKKCGVQIVLEVVNRFESNLLNTTAQGLKFIRDTGRDDVYLHLDSFHMNIEESDPAAAVRLAGDKLGYYHIGESYRGYLGTGTVDFPGIFSALADIGYDGDMTFESFSSAIVDEKLSIVCGIWRNTWTDNNSLASHARAFIEQKWEEAKTRRDIGLQA